MKVLLVTPLGSLNTPYPRCQFYRGFLKTTGWSGFTSTFDALALETLSRGTDSRQLPILQWILTEPSDTSGYF